MYSEQDDPKDVPRSPEEADDGATPQREADDEASHEDFDPQNDPAYNPEDEGLKGIKGG